MSEGSWLPAKRLPYRAPDPSECPAGLREKHEGGKSYCLQCAPVSMYWFDKPRVPGWVRLPHRPRARRVPTCHRCEREIR